MTNNNQLARIMKGDEWNSLRERAAVLIKSGMVPASLNTPEKLITVILAGRELGIGEMASLRNIYPIQGVPTIAPRLQLALAIASKELEDWRCERFADSVKVTVTRRGRSAHSEVFGRTEAIALNLMNKDNYKKQPFTMFKWRALSAALNFTFPDVLMGMMTPEEMGAEVIVSDSDDLNIKEVRAPGKTEAKDADVAIELALDKAESIHALMMERHGGDIDEAEKEMVELTTYKSVNGESTYVKLAELGLVARQNPSWIDKIAEKIQARIDEELAGSGVEPEPKKDGNE